MPGRSTGENCEFNVGKDLTSTQELELRRLLEGHEDSFVRQGEKLGLATFRTSPERIKIMNGLLEEHRSLDIIEECPEPTEWASPATLVEKGKKAGGKRAYRLVCDYRHLNKNIKSQSQSFPRKDDTLNKLGGLKGRYFSTLDAYSGFFQIPIRKRDRDLTAFTTPGKTWRFKTMPMGIKSAPKFFNSIVETLIRHLPNCLPYVDDLIIASSTWDRHLEDILGVFKAFRDANIKFLKI